MPDEIDHIGIFKCERAAHGSHGFSAVSTHE